jgi:hypothetical protein
LCFAWERVWRQGSHESLLPFHRLRWWKLGGVEALLNIDFEKTDTSKNIIGVRSAACCFIHGKWLIISLILSHHVSCLRDILGERRSPRRFITMNLLSIFTPGKFSYFPSSNHVAFQTLYIAMCDIPSGNFCSRFFEHK